MEDNRNRHVPRSAERLTVVEGWIERSLTEALREREPGARDVVDAVGITDVRDHHEEPGADRDRREAEARARQYHAARSSEPDPRTVHGWDLRTSRRHGLVTRHPTGAHRRAPVR